ncbi:unnamed protein product [Vitrella brassicaformis CCMP3155]|uniref:Uncharacterized protein n=2 Tax=Vitrella brassicaformis TaxID=1169539 RepID=A0A0G4FY58_VITBC|nr:unnamed protein product [Vitrella brassicaformis CCMP3155]|eukprot:CEM20366.1 unnamed protein product [Vitrella brassicaformis CCMP3155]
MAKDAARSDVFRKLLKESRKQAIRETLFIAEGENDSAAVSYLKDALSKTETMFASSPLAQAQQHAPARPGVEQKCASYSDGAIGDEPQEGATHAEQPDDEGKTVESAVNVVGDARQADFESRVAVIRSRLNGVMSRLGKGKGSE